MAEPAQRPAHSSYQGLVNEVGKLGRGVVVVLHAVLLQKGLQLRLQHLRLGLPSSEQTQ